MVEVESASVKVNLGALGFSRASGGFELVLVELEGCIPYLTSEFLSLVWKANGIARIFGRFGVCCDDSMRNREN